MNEIYAIVWKESKEVLSPQSYEKYWPSYGQNSLYGWRPPKKIYFKLGLAKSGFSHIPEQMKPLLEIAKFTFSETVADGNTLMQKQKITKQEKEKLRKQRHAQYELKQAQKALEQAQKNIKSLN